MTLQDLMLMVGSLVDWKFELTPEGKIPQELVSFFNACSADLTSIARYAKRAVLTFDPLTTPNEFMLPSDFYELPESGLWFNGAPLKELELTDTASMGFRRWGKTIILQGLTTSGTIEVFYYASLPRFIGNPNEEPVIPPPFHDLYALYAGMKWRQGEPGRLEEKNDLQAEYLQRRLQFEIYAMSNDAAPYPATKEG